MAYVPSSLDAQGDEQKRLNISGTSSGPVASSAGTVQSTGAPPPSGSSGGFTNIRDYLQANETGAVGLGRTVGNKIGSEVSQASDALTAGRTAAETGIRTGTVAYDPNKVTQTINTGVADTSVRNMLRGTYGGPSDLSAARPTIDREFGEAKTIVDQAGTAGGRIDLLRTLTGRPQTTGVTRLNSALLQGNEQARGLVNTAVGGYAPLEGNLTKAEADIAKAAQTAAATNAATRNTTVGRLNTYLDEQEAAAGTRLTDARATETARQAAIRNYLTSVSGIVAADPGRSQAGGSGGLVDASTPEGRSRALSTPARESNQMVSRQSIATPQRVLGPNEDTMGPRNPNSVIVNVGTPTTAPAPMGPFQTPTTTPAVDALLAQANAVPLRPGWEEAGLTRAQARELQNAAYLNNADKGTALDLTRYYTAGDVSQLNQSNVLTGEQAERFNALAALAGRDDRYNAGAANLQNRIDYDRALANLRANRDAAIAARPVPPPPPPPAPPPPPVVVPPPVAPPPPPVVDPVTESGGGGPGGPGVGGGGANDNGGVGPGSTGSAGTGSGSNGSSVGADASDGGSNAGDGTSSSTGSGADADGGIGGSGVGDTAGIGSTAGSGNDGTDGDGVGGVSSNGDDGSSDGGGGGGGGKIICTMMNDWYGLPYNENKVWLKYSKTHLKPEHQVGYHAVFLPLIEFAKKPGFINGKVRDALFWIGKNRTIDIQDELAGRNPRPIKRALIRWPIENGLALLGRILK